MSEATTERTALLETMVRDWSAKGIRWKTVLEHVNFVLVARNCPKASIEELDALPTCWLSATTQGKPHAATP